ncbi:arabinose 5-phosphate isomerase KdsD [mine drainage metagenome]|uniref:Arabinose 5-phosphate isomerase KdsD n=1 Tax=mine drainage metagenome TaxID=410659 RepID=A0A1J5QFI5_9ZZZZ
MITQHDAVLALSNSGETPELTDVVSFCRRFDIPLVAITSRADTALAQAALDNLPSVMDELRRERQSRALQPRLALSHPATSTPDTAAGSETAAPGRVSISVERQTDRDSLDQAYSLLLRGQYEAALRYYSDVAAASPQNLPAQLGRAIALHKLGRLAEARQTYYAVLHLDRHNPQALANLLTIIAHDSPDYAIGQLRRLQADTPGYSPITAQLAEILAKSGHLTEAITEMGAALQDAPDNGLYRLNLAILQDQAGLRDDALTSYRLALISLQGAPTAPLGQIRDRIRYLQQRR